ncbi:MAG: hypothetical protein J0I84_07895, partial [Terrimonas sp.]|nr:hypothetical protein [Terrimonas sp.]
MGLGDGPCFAAMLQSALQDWPDHDVLVKVHPDVRTHRKTGWLRKAALDHP